MPTRPFRLATLAGAALASIGLAASAALCSPAQASAPPIITFTAHTGTGVGLGQSTLPAWPGEVVTLQDHISSPVPPGEIMAVYADGATTPIGVCGPGATTCLTTINTATTSGGFTAYLGVPGKLKPWLFPPQGVIVTSGHVNVQSLHWPVGLGGNLTKSSVGGSLWLSAGSTVNVAPSPYYLTIFDETADTVVRSCGTGSQCGTYVSESSAGTHKFVAFVGPAGATPSQALSISPQPQYRTWTATPGWGVSLHAATGSSAVTFTATTNADIGPSPYYTQLYDAVSGERLQICSTGTTCSVSEYSGAYAVVAVVGPASAVVPTTGAVTNSYTVGGAAPSHIH